MNPRSAFIYLSFCIIVCGCALSTSGEKLDDRSTPPLRSAKTDLEVIAALDVPPGNIAVSPQGRIFISFHPEAGPDVKIAELVSGDVTPYPDAPAQQEIFKTPLALRIDQQSRLWVLDYGSHGFSTPRLMAFGLNTDRLVHEFEFPSHIAGLGSMLNDFQVDADGQKIYITDMENSAIHRVGPDRKLRTLFKDTQKLRWPDGFSFGPGRFLYLTDSALQNVIMKSSGKIQQTKPYYVYRFDSGYKGTPGH